MSAKIIPFKVVHSDVKCSFCLKPKSEVKRMFTNGIDKYICDKCVTVCKTRADSVDED